MASNLVERFTFFAFIFLFFWFLCCLGLYHIRSYFVQNEIFGIGKIIHIAEGVGLTAHPDFTVYNGHLPLDNATVHDQLNRHIYFHAINFFGKSISSLQFFAPIYPPNDVLLDVVDNEFGIPYGESDVENLKR